MNTNHHDDHQEPLDANLAKLICKDNLPPAPSDDEKAAMIERLRAKQTTLAATQSGRSRRTIRLLPLALGGLAAAALVTLGAFLVFPLRPDPSLSTTDAPSEETVEQSSERPAVAPPPTITPPPAVPAPVVHEAPDRPRRIELRDGSTAIAAPGTRFTEHAPRQLELHEGSLYLLVAKADAPLEVVTPQGKALALGTRFLVSSSEADTRVAVAQGSVRLERADDDQFVELARGEEGVLAASETIRRPAPRLSHLVNWAQGALRDGDLIDDEEGRQNGLIVVDPNGQESRLSLRNYTLDVHLDNGVARTTIDQTFFNHHHGNTEGTFYFPLPPGAAVSRMAMYVNGIRNEAGMVERHRGQEIYNDIKYANRDPALLEQLEGNLYKLRIFPLEGRQEKRLFISFTQAVDELYGTLRYWFPMDHTHENAGRVKINVRVKHGEELFDAESSTHKFARTVEDGDLVLTYETDNIKPDQDLLLNLIPKFEQRQIAETAVLVREDRNYLHTRIRPELEGAVEARPRQWFVLSDTSASRSAGDLKAQAHIVARLLAEADDHDEVAIANLNIDTERLTKELVALDSEAAKQAVEKMRSASCLGGTNLADGIASIRAWITATGAANPHIVYLGDGLATDGQTTSRELTALLDPKVPFIGLAVGKKADLSFLRAAANATGGAAFLMNPDEDLNWRVFDMLASFNTPRLTNIRCEFPEAAEDLAAYADRNTLAAGEALTLVAATAGELPKEVTIRGQLDGEPWEKTIALEPARKDAGFIPRFWAQRHIEELLKDGDKHREEIVRWAKLHYVATPFTSLIVLEDDKMYQDYNVEKGLNDHWAAYPAPDEIPVVREPIPWIARSWRQQGNTVADDSTVKTDPQSADEILDTILPTSSAPPALPVNRLLYKAEGFMNLGLYDEAIHTYTNVLRVDRYNREARRGMERVHQFKSDYYRSAYDETRARLPDVVGFDWYDVTDWSTNRSVLPPLAWGGASLWTHTELQRHYRDVDWGTYLHTLPNLETLGDGGGGGWTDRFRTYTGVSMPSDGLLLGGLPHYIAPFPSDQFAVSDELFIGGGTIGNGQARTAADFISPVAFTTIPPFEAGGYDPYVATKPLVGHLTSAIPGLQTRETDRASPVEMTLGREKRGSITNEAAALVRAAEARRRPLRIEGMIVTPDGRLKRSATTPLFLKEETVSDGESWFRIYRELGFATRRPVTPSNLAAIQALVPHWPPSLHELEARWEVTLAKQANSFFEIALVDPDDKERRQHLIIANDGRLLESRLFNDDEPLGALLFDYEGDSVTVTTDSGATERYEAVEIEVADVLFVADTEGMVVLDLPLRKPGFYEKQLAALDDNDVDKRKQLLRHLIVSKFRDTRIQPVAVAPPVRVPSLPDDAPDPAGDAATEPAPKLLTPNAAWTQLIQLGGGSTPVFDHLTLAAALDITSVVTNRSDFLAHFKEVVALGAGEPSREAVEAFLRKWPSSPFVLSLVQRCPNKRAWIALLDQPEHRARAIEAIAIYGQDDWHDRAELASRIAEFLAAQAADGNPSLITPHVAQFLGREQDANEPWQRVVEAYRALRDRLPELEPASVAAVLDLAIREKDTDLERRCLDQLLAQRKSPHDLAVIADIFSSHERHETAAGLYKRALAEIEEPGTALLQRAAAAIQPVDDPFAIRLERRALRKLAEANLASNKQALDRHYRQLLERALSAGDLETATQLAMEGYNLQSDHHALITAVASYFHEQGEATESWRWLSTILDRHPKNAEASGALGDWYEQHRLLDDAAAMFANAHSFDSAHPQWLGKQARTLYRAGEFEKADTLYRELIDTEWAHQLKRQVPVQIEVPLLEPGTIGAFGANLPGPGWEQPAFDDRGWQRRSCRFDADESDAEFWDEPFCTRQRFRVARTPRRVDLQVDLHAAECEVFLNGKPVQRFTGEDADAGNRSRTIQVTLDPQLLNELRVGENVLAVRYQKTGTIPRANVRLTQVFAPPEPDRKTR